MFLLTMSYSYTRFAFLVEIKCGIALDKLKGRIENSKPVK